jgi:uncharacterized protein (TIGR02099 family)
MVKRAIRWVPRFAAAGIIVLAAVISLLRLSLPRIGDYRPEIERRVSEYIAQPVVIEEISADWRGWVPEIRLENIELRDPGGTRPLTRFAHAAVAIDPWASLRARRLVPGRLTVSGVELSLLRSADGRLRIEGVDPAATAVPGARQNALADWLQQQQNLTIESATITWHDEQALLAPVVFSDVLLQIRSDGKRRQLVGSARLPKAVGKAFSFLLDARGDLLTTQWSGEFFVEGRGINPAAVLDFRQWLGVELRSGDLDFRLWSRWQDARLNSIDGQVSARNLAIGLRDRAADAGTTLLPAVKGNLRVSRTADNRWALALEKLDVVGPNGAWPQTNLAVTLVPRPGEAMPTIVGRAGFLRLDDVTALALSVNGLPETIRTPLRELNPRGDLAGLRVGYFPDRPEQERFYVHAQFAGIDVQPYRGLPGIGDLKATLKADANGGRVNFTGAPLAVELAAPHAATLALDRVRGELRWTRRADGWLLASDKLALTHKALSMTVNGEIGWQPGSAPVAALFADIPAGDLGVLAASLPPGALPPRGQQWFETAVRAGQVRSGAAVLRGPLDRFPFDEHDGVFAVRLDLTGGILAFSPAWPALEGIDGSILFEGRQLKVIATRAHMLGAQVSGVEAVVPNLGIRERQFLGHGRMSASAIAARELIDASPLKDRLGRELEAVEVDGSLSLDLDLDLALYPDGPRASAGVLHLPGNRVAVPKLRLVLEGVQGDLRFDRGRWRAEQMTATYLDTPVTLALEGGNIGPHSATYTLRGRADAGLIKRQMEITAPVALAWLDQRKWLERITGAADWQATLNAGPIDSDGTRSLALGIALDLQGLGIDLPAPIGKPAGDVRGLRIEATLAGAERHVDLHYGDVLSARLALVRDENAATSRLTAATVSLGATPELGLTPERIRYHGDVPSVSIGDWYDALAIRDPSVFVPPRTLPIEFEVRIATLELFRQSLGAVAAVGSDTPEWWQIELDGEKSKGRVEIPRRDGAPIRATMQALALAKPAPDTGARATDPRKWLPVEATCESFTFDTIDLGRTELKTARHAQGVDITALRFDSDDVRVQATGTWRVENELQNSHFDIDASGPDLGRMLTRFGYDVAAIKGGDTEVGIDAGWDGSPTDFSLANLHGELSLRVEDGRMLDVNPKAGRLFGLLSIQTLPRRLFLDFTDLFSKGFTFDSIDGVFTLEHGNAYTTNLTVEGPSARIEVSGRTGLAMQDYDQVVTVRPQISSSLPVAGALFGPAGVGVGAALYLGQKIFKGMPGQIDDMLRRQYTVTGNWDDPVVEQVKGLDLSFGS